jgi:uncharacterized protein Yka (UPF0111/DUF47 family)
MSRVRHREAVFYDYFRQSTKIIVQAAELFDRIVGEWPASKPLIPQMKELETRHDELTGSVIDELNRSFITPFDRGDIYSLISLLDGIVDGLEGVSARFDIYGVNEMVQSTRQMSGLILQCAHELDTLFEHFENFKRDGVVLEKVKRVSDLEDEGDLVYRRALGEVFSSSADPVHVLKWKSLLDKTEDALDNCKHVTNVVHSVVMKNA